MSKSFTTSKQETDKKNKKTPVIDLPHLLSHLMSGCILMRHASQENAQEDLYALRRSQRGITLHVAFVSAALVHQLISDGAVKRQGEGALQLSRAGRLKAKRNGLGGFLAQHMQLAVVEEQGKDGIAKMLINQSENPLAVIAHRKDADGSPWLGSEHLAAGDRLRSDFTLSGLSPRMGIAWDLGIAQGAKGFQPNQLELTETIIAARQRLQRAMRAVGPSCADLLLDVCCFLKGLEQIELERGWPQRSAKLALRFALEALARHYGLASEARGPSIARRIEQWGTEDYRPVID